MVTEQGDGTQTVFEAKQMIKEQEKIVLLNSLFSISPLYQYIRRFETHGVPSGAGEGISGVLNNLFNDSSVEAKILAYQLKLLSPLLL